MRSIRSYRLFSAPPGAPRSRRPTDAVLLVIALIGLAVTSLSAEPPARLSNDLTQVVTDSPAWLLSTWQVFFDLMPVWAGLVILLSIVRRYFVLAVAGVGAAALGLVFGYLAHRLALAEPTDFGDFVSVFSRSEGPTGFPAIRMVVTTAVLAVASPGLSRPFRFFGRVVLGLGFLATVGLGAATLTGAAGGLAAGAAAAALVHLAVGSPGGRPSPRSVTRTLAELGVEVRDVAPALIQPAGVAAMSATHVDGRDLEVKVYGRDAWDSQLIAKLWRFVWYRNGRSTLLLSRLHQVEHEALLTVLAGRAGTAVPDVLVAGESASGDAALVSTVGGVRLESVVAEGSPAAVASPDLAELWGAIQPVHSQGIVHGSLDLRSVTLDDHGAPLLTDWSAASAAAPASAVDLERAQLLVVTALVAGARPAIEAAQGALEPDDFGRLVPYLQVPALTNEIRRDVRERDFDVDELRDLATEAAGVDEVELVQLRRVTLKSIVSMGVLAVAAMLLISSLSEIGLDTIVNELSSANLAWVLTALLVAQVARLFSGIGTTGATSHPLRLGPTVALEFAITFVNLAIPSSAARIATKMRYFQKAGMTITSATAMGAIDSLAGFGVQISILVSALVFGLGGVEFDIDVDTESVERLATLIAVVVVVLVVGAAAAWFLVAGIRERVRSTVRQFVDALRVVRSPERLFRLIGGNLAAEVVFASVLGISLLAYGEDAGIMSLLVINVGVALFSGLMPIPGGIGVTEAALTAGLVAIGIPEPTAFAAAITTRLCTFYLPPIWGYVAMKWLRKNQYL